MSFLMSPPAGPRQDATGDDGLDNLLRAYFKAQVPDPWPSFEAPPDQHILPLPSVKRHPLVRSRLALAASVALLVAGPWLLNGALQPTTGSETVPPEVSSKGQRPTANNKDRDPPAPGKAGSSDTLPHDPMNGSNVPQHVKPIFSEDWQHN